MKNKYILQSGLLLSLFLLLLLLPTKTFALEGDCIVKYCFVPAPTILVPENDSVVGKLPVFRALTWKPTIVKLFVDDIEVENVEQKKHEDQYGSVFASLDYNLTPGDHYVYAIAYHENGGWGGQSKVSKYIYFNVENEVITTHQEEVIYNNEPLIDVISDQNVPQFEVINKNTDGQVEITEQGIIEGGVFVEKDEEYVVNEIQETASVTDLDTMLQDEFIESGQQETEKRNRFIGLIMLIIILLITIIWFSLDYINSRRIKMLDEEDEGYLPPPPEPPKGRNVKSEDISYHEITDEWLDQMEGPPPSQSSPYPVPDSELEVIDEEKRNDLGL
ncbi:hypothetical protein HOE31_03885 [bacterium]|jgi:hypothetical protein|nr:hypothetical protein [bacterium]MBT4122059.1 hypothetical protein [bacterium]MBT4335537.1 hypothetical protein [bacterium]MBT4495306.1 hypothetical protein [bacterium]MBT4763663.1 hypothetical protein [bacterium]